MITATDSRGWAAARIRRDEIDKYLRDGRDFIPDADIHEKLLKSGAPDKGRVREILAKSMRIETLLPDETAELIRVTDPQLLDEMRETALKVKKKVYDNRIVTFAPLYLGNKCVNNCVYCGFRSSNGSIRRSVLSTPQIRSEVEALAGRIGHKRLILVYGEHPETDIDYMVDSIRTVYDVKVPVKNAVGNIRRVNVNAAPMSVDELRRLNEAGLGTYQVFQETYHRGTYGRLHPAATVKGDYRWRLYAMHRAMEAGIDDVGIGALFGLYDWRYEVMALVYHAWELENTFGIGPHTVSFPRLEPAHNTPYTDNPPFAVSDEDFKKIILVIRLAIPYTGMILTARETADMRRAAINLGITQTDASTKIGVGCYADEGLEQTADKQQFVLGDTRSLDEVIADLAGMGLITSFCTAGYRCGRTGKCIMDLLRSGTEGKFCKLNAVLTFREWLDDFAPQEARAVAEKTITAEIGEIREKLPNLYPKFIQAYERTKKGERDLCF
jgi:2-iminoacetate synthase